MTSQSAKVRAEPKWRRMTSSDRREQLLEVTGELICKHGLNSFTMETLALKAGVSKPLVYKYFSTRLALLQALLLREYTRRDQRLERDVSEADSFPEVLRLLVADDFDRFSGRDLIRTLRGQSDVEEVLKPVIQKSGDKFGDLLVSLFLRQYHLEPAVARRVLRMTSGASIEAAQRYTVHGGDRDAHIEETVQYALGGINAFVGRAKNG